MPARRKTTQRTRVEKTPAQKARKALIRTWQDTREALGNAERTIGRRVRALVRRSSVRREQAGELLQTWRGRIERERRKAAKQLDLGFATLQARARRERKALGRAVGNGVAGTLAAFNIPSRQEVHDLTRRVEELSRKVDGFRRKGTVRRAVSSRIAAPVQA